MRVGIRESMRAELRMSDRRAEERIRRGELRAAERRPERGAGVRDAKGELIEYRGSGLCELRGLILK